MLIPPNENPELKYQHFYEKESRKKYESDNINIGDINSSIFEDIFINNKDKCYSHFSNVDSHPLLALIKNPGMFQNTNIEEVQRTTCDEQFHLYMLETSMKSNRNYYKFALKFVLLFRECINKIKVTDIPETYK
jgi:hypothetical protein